MMHYNTSKYVIQVIMRLLVVSTSPKEKKVQLPCAVPCVYSITLIDTHFH